MPRRSDARQKMIRSAAALFREHGVQGTSFTDVVEHSGAPRGSIYHHFQGGKAELAEESTIWAGEFIATGMARALAENDPVEAIAVYADGWKQLLRESGFSAGCAVVAGALEGEREPRARDAAAQAFSTWETQLTDVLQRRGLEPDRARSIGTLVVASIEGSIILARAQRMTEPLDRVVGELQALIAAALREPHAPAQGEATQSASMDSGAASGSGETG